MTNYRQLFPLSSTSLIIISVFCPFGLMPETGQYPSLFGFPFYVFFDCFRQNQVEKYVFSTFHVVTHETRVSSHPLVESPV